MSDVQTIKLADTYDAGEFLWVCRQCGAIELDVMIDADEVAAHLPPSSDNAHRSIRRCQCCDTVYVSEWSTVTFHDLASYAIVAGTPSDYIQRHRELRLSDESTWSTSPLLQHAELPF